MTSMRKFLQEVKIEFSKIVWPKPEVLVGSLLVVLFLVLLFSLYLGAIDFVFYRAMNFLFARAS